MSEETSGHSGRDTQNESAAKGGQRSNDTQGSRAPLISSIRETHRERQDFHRAEKSLTLQIKARCRRLCGGDKKEAGTLYDAMLGKGEHNLSKHALVANGPFLESRAILEGVRKAAEKQLNKLSKELAVAAFVEATPGMGYGSLGAIVGECGDLSNYANPAKFWKRMGLAVMPDGKRQRRVAGAEALDHGYSPSRRSVMWNVGQSVFKAQSARIDKDTGEVLREAGPYRILYDKRKAYELERNPDIKPIIAHNRSTRYLEKRLLRELWRAWRDAP